MGVLSSALKPIIRKAKGSLFVPARQIPTPQPSVVTADRTDIKADSTLQTADQT